LCFLWPLARAFEASTTSSAGGDSCASVAIQWQNWLHSGSSALGASGSVRAIVSWILELFPSLEVKEEEGTTSNRAIEGCFLAFLGLMLFPRSAAVFFQVTFWVRRGVKGSRMVGIMFAFSSLRGVLDQEFSWIGVVSLGIGIGIGILFDQVDLLGCEIIVLAENWLLVGDG
jgi:hypothetical protein